MCFGIAGHRKNYKRNQIMGKLQKSIPRVGMERLLQDMA